MQARHIRLLEPGKNGVRKVSQPIASKGHDSNYVLKGILDTPERDDEVSQLLVEFDRMADDGDFNQAQRVLDDLDSSHRGPVLGGRNPASQIESASPDREMRGSAKGREPEELRTWKELQQEAGIELEYDALPGGPSATR